MSVEQNKAVIRHFFEGINSLDWNSPDEIDWNIVDRLIDECIADDYYLHDPSRYAGIEPGKVGFKKWARQLYTNIAHIHVTIEDCFGEGDKVVTRYTAMFVDSQTGKKMTGTSLSITLHKNGKMSQEWELVQINPSA